MTIHAITTEGYATGRGNNHYLITGGFDTSVPWIDEMLKKLEQTSVTDCMWQPGIFKPGIFTHGPMDRRIIELES